MACSYCGRSSERSICPLCMEVLHGIRRPPMSCGLEARTVVTPKTVEKSKPHVPSREELERLAREIDFWGQALCGVPGVAAIYDGLRAQPHVWTMPRFENIVSYGSREQAERLNDSFDGTPPHGICGVTANRLATLFLGQALGERVVEQLNTFLSRTQPSPYREHDSTREGHGIQSLRQTFTRWTHCIAVIQGGPTHRFLAERRPEGYVVLYQSWVEAFSLTHWLDTSNSARHRIEVDRFLELLEQAAANGSDEERLEANRALFHPVGRNLTEALHQNARISYSACQVRPRSVPANVAYFFKYSTFDEAKFAD